MDSQKSTSLASGKKDIWLNALTDPLAGTSVPSTNICLSDINGDGKYALIIADDKRLLRVWRGGSVVSQLALLDTPTAVFSFYADRTLPMTPWIGVICGNLFYFYKTQNGILRPKAKFELPVFEPIAEEAKVWEGIKKGSMQLEDALGALEQIRDDGSVLTPSAQRLLALENEDAQEALLEDIKSKGAVWRPCATCCAVIHNQIEDETDLSHLVIGTEARRLMVLSPANSKMLLSLNLPGVPCCLAVDGEFTTDYRIAVGFRNGSVGIVRDGKVNGNVIATGTGIVGLAIFSKRIYIARMDKLFEAYTIKGKCLFSLQLPSYAVAMEMMVMKTARQFKGIILSLENGDVLVFNNKTVVSATKVPDIVGMRFGFFESEEGALVTTQKGGTLRIGLIQRQANLDESASLSASSSSTAALDEQDIPIVIPKRSAVFFEQAQAEAEGCQAMYRRFQRDLAKIRLETSRAYVSLLSTSGGKGLSGAHPGGGAGAGLISNFVQVSAQIQGLGPKFNVVLVLSCVAKVALVDLFMTLQANEEITKITQPVRMLPTLLPGSTTTVVVSVQCIDPSGAADTMKIAISAKRHSTPLLMAMVRLPPSETFDMVE
ncbi:putative bardet-Biedl syndrome 1 family protein [Monocercomonoides exilis]|uniref:putative bardet-Biedl syndrome 1 family protein n=1 Tax=Monocercomonoides exilis TaxID=2049356 RepID=UPI003559E4FB|nr:putative bardet-Biedl syndrome 1 family protein [Monocercomonoides exilis]|eukprot:MONOS_7166.1-p1 / transcript=MONOS_7166.1 / gene=MONOS_7166 / organism=Monocercomonoides_exilis_PA203 / gene_product=bardet-Biedl syndrome 1 family protein / transcript_product=bardet-Biedl syndrome 1 family protein / location=Mono_scaffold00239:10530-12961(-) / protein_length=602 / sequence_SO=supercontig / SO=protein_coding / is_pseudo=false